MKKNKQQNKVSFFGGLPDEILQYIFSFTDLQTLLSLSLVSRRFKQNAEDPNLYISHGFPSRDAAKEVATAKRSEYYTNALNIVTALKMKQAVCLYFLGNAGNMQEHLWEFLSSNSVLYSFARSESCKYVVRMPKEPYELKSTIDVRDFYEPTYFYPLSLPAKLPKIFFLLSNDDKKLQFHHEMISEHNRINSIICVATSESIKLDSILSNNIILNLKKFPSYLDSESDSYSCCGFDAVCTKIMHDIVKQIFAITQFKLFNTVCLILNKNGTSFKLRANDNYKLRRINKADYIHPLLRKITPSHSHEEVLTQLKWIKEDECCQQSMRFYHQNNVKCGNYNKAKKSIKGIMSGMHEDSIEDIISFVAQQMQKPTSQCRFM